MNWARTAALLAGVWAGVLVAIAAFAAPAAFATLDAPLAGRVVARLFAQEAMLSLALAVVLILIERRLARRAAAEGQGSLVSAELLLVLGALFCTVFGHYGLQPMIAAARAGQGAWSFAALHAASVGLFGLKALLVLALAWRLTGRTPARPPATPPRSS